MGRIPIDLGANHGGVVSLASFGYVSLSGIWATRRYWNRVVVGGIGAVFGECVCLWWQRAGDDQF